MSKCKMQLTIYIFINWNPIIQTSRSQYSIHTQANTNRRPRTMHPNILNQIIQVPWFIPDITQIKKLATKKHSFKIAPKNEDHLYKACEYHQFHGEPYKISLRLTPLRNHSNNQDLALILFLMFLNVDFLPTFY